MALTFPLFHRPGSILFLDDDVEYLELVGMALPAQLQIELFARPSVFAQRMAEEPARWEADAALQLHMIERWRHGHALLPQVLHYWGSSPERYHLAKTVVVDYVMPGVNGLQVLNSLLDWPGSRVLLTGQADEQIAVQAFNGGLLDQYVPKQTDGITRHLMSVLSKLGAAAHPRLNTLWRSALLPWQQSMLQMPSVVQQLENSVLKQWVEYVVLGQPFGLLGMDASGQCQWLQMEPTSSLNEHAELATTAGLSYNTVRAIQSGALLAAVEVHQQLKRGGTVPTAAAFPMGDAAVLTAALFDLGRAQGTPTSASYNDVLRAKAQRPIQDN